MFSCKHATRLISDAMDRKLSRRERISLRVHLLICGICRACARQLEIIRTAMREYINPEDDLIDSAGHQLTPQARLRIGQAINAES